MAAQGWVNELNVRDSLTPTNAANDDTPNPNYWNGKTKTVTITHGPYAEHIRSMHLIIT